MPEHFTIARPATRSRPPPPPRPGADMLIINGGRIRARRRPHSLHQATHGPPQSRPPRSAPGVAARRAERPISNAPLARLALNPITSAPAMPHPQCHFDIPRLQPPHAGPLPSARLGPTPPPRRQASWVGPAWGSHPSGGAPAVERVERPLAGWGSAHVGNRFGTYTLGHHAFWAARAGELTADCPSSLPGL
jgi:hypothetical protein